MIQTIKLLLAITLLWPILAYAKPMALSAQSNHGSAVCNRQIGAKATTWIQMKVNLYVGEGIPNVRFNSNDPKSYNFHYYATIHDTLGADHHIQFYFVRHTYLEWYVHIIIDRDQEIAIGRLLFTPDGLIKTIAGLDNIKWDAIAPHILTINLSRSTLFPMYYRVEEFEQNGTDLFACGS